MTDIEEEFKNCKIAIKQMKQYEPDPFYINFFLNRYIESMIKIFSGIFEEADRDFGLFISGVMSQESFEEKNKVKKDEKVKEFLEWYELRHKKEYVRSSSKFIKRITELNQKKKMPKIKVMIRSKQRFANDIFQEIKIRLSNGKLISKDELRLEIKKQIPAFLERLNIKRQENREPIAKKNHVIASTVVEIEGRDFEIIYFSEMYLKVVKRIVNDSRNKIRELKSESKII